jgi:hypothetical protein
MKPPLTGRVHRPTLDDVELVDTVRSRLVQGHDRAALPRQLHLLFGVDEEAVVRAIAVVDDEERGAELVVRSQLAQVVAVAIGGGLFLSSVARTSGAPALAALGLGAATVAVIVIVADLLRRRR